MRRCVRNASGKIPEHSSSLMTRRADINYSEKLLSFFKSISTIQHGTGVSVEAVDPVFQTNMLDMLMQTGRSEMVVGWYHSHPGFGCWLSGVDMNTQTSFEQLNTRAVCSNLSAYLYDLHIALVVLLIISVITCIHSVFCDIRWQSW